ncbi:MAG TPA: glycosyltransferase [Acidimicrobiales bacterium]|nr:glycosyltransferase [Acidimicrobiales bacterium]
MNPKVDVVVVSYRSSSVLPSCIAGARGISELGRIVVVDHDEDGSGGIAMADDVLVLRTGDNPGFGAGQNLGMLQTNAPFVLLLNPDAIVEPEAITAGVKLLEERSRVGALQGAIKTFEGGLERSQGRSVGPVHLLGRCLGLRGLLQFAPFRWIGRQFPSIADHVDRGPELATVVETLSATALLVRRTAFDSVGGFDTSYFLYGEDLDLCVRLRKAGWQLMALPAPWARHIGGSSSRSRLEREARWWQGTMSFAARWFGSAAWAIAMASSAVMTLRLVVRHPARYGRLVRMMILGPWRLRRSLRSSRTVGGGGHG